MSSFNFQSQQENLEFHYSPSQNEQQYDITQAKNYYQQDSFDQQNYGNQHSMSTNSKFSAYQRENKYNHYFQYTNEEVSLQMDKNNYLSDDSKYSQYCQSYQQQSEFCINQNPKNQSLHIYEEDDVSQHENNNQNCLQQDQNNSNNQQFTQNCNNNFNQQQYFQNENQQQLVNTTLMLNQFQENKNSSSNQNIVIKQQNSMDQDNTNQKDKKNYKPQHQCKECENKKYKNHSGLTNHVKKIHPGRKTSDLSMEPNITLGRKRKFKNNQQN